MVALIPARAGSKRIPGKNTRFLGGIPLFWWAVLAAHRSGVFERIVVSSDDWDIVNHFPPITVEGLIRPAELATDTAPDILWVRHALKAIPRPVSFAILRPTSPFRSAETIRRAYQQFMVGDGTHDSLRAVRRVTENPYKMWTWQGDGYPMKPLLAGTAPDGQPLHSSASQLAPPVYVQTGALEMGYTSNVETHGTISGRKIIPFLTDGPESLDLNTEADWAAAEALIASGAVEPPAAALARV